MLTGRTPKRRLPLCRPWEAFRPWGRRRWRSAVMWATLRPLAAWSVSAAWRRPLPPLLRIPASDLQQNTGGTMQQNTSGMRTLSRLLGGSVLALALVGGCLIVPGHAAEVDIVACFDGAVPST